MKQGLLGEILVAKQWITDQQLASALALQKNLQLPIGRILINHGYINESQLSEGLAAQYTLPFFEHLHQAKSMLPSDPEIAASYLNHLALPIQIEGKHYLVLSHFTPAHDQWLQTLDPIPVAMAPLSAIIAIYAQLSLPMDAMNRHWHITPRSTARQVFSRTQAILCILFLCLFGIECFLIPKTMFYVGFGLLNLLCLMSMGIKLWLGWRGYQQQQCPVISPQALFSPSTLPTYSLLIPLYQEHHIIRQIRDGIESLYYPGERLDVICVVEADDHMTIQSLIEHEYTAWCSLVVVPPSHPRTKAKACNYALPFTKGQFVVVYDAESMPHSEQIWQALLCFTQSTPQLANVQAPLHLYNAYENMISQCFTVEYCYWYGVLVPGLTTTKLPVALGGNSGHFRREALYHLRGWDPFNVTEDADLGVRLARAGYQVRMIREHTLEEAPIYATHWLNQRRRWVKGFMQTCLLHLRELPLLYRQCGVSGILYILDSMGLHPLRMVAWSWVWLSNIVMLLVPAWRWDLPLPLCVLAWASCMGMLTYCMVQVAYTQKRYPGLLRMTWLFYYTLYPFLHSLAAIQAVYDLLIRPHHWHKTIHGLTRIRYQPSWWYKRGKRRRL